jgi:N-acetylmuramoyl-L-alanine amidase CwlA
MVTVIKNLVSKSIADKVSYDSVNTKKYIIIHETGNKAKGADAKSHGNLQANGNSRQASWHYSVDDKVAVQSFDHKVSCWAAGNETGNKQGIQIEICVNEGGDFKKAVRNTSELVKEIMKQENIRIDYVKQHNFFSGKNCPENLRNGNKGITFNNLIEMIKEVPKPIAPKKIYKVQVGAFSDLNNAKKLSEELKKKGYENIII